MTPNKLVVLLKKKKKLIFWRSYCIYLVLCIWFLRQHLKYFNAETQAKIGQILQLKHIEALEIYKTDHHTKWYNTYIQKVLSFQQLFMLLLLCIPSTQSLTTKRSSKTCPTKTIIHLPIMRISPLWQFFVALKHFS